MSLTSALSVALSGLQVATAQLQLSANNIANAQKPGFTEKTAIVNSVASDSGGAVITGFKRTTNDALSKSYNEATSSSSYLNTQNDYLKQVQTILDSSDSSPALTEAASQFQAAWTQYASAPDDSAQQQALIQAGSNLAAQIRTISSGVLNLNNQVTTDTLNTVKQLNSDLTQVAALNQQIEVANSVGQSTGNLEDQRDLLVNDVASITSVTIMPRANGQIALYTPQGTVLLDNSAQQFTYDGTNITSASGQTVTNNLTGGSLQAELQFKFNGSPAAASTAPGVEVIRKLNSQLQAITKAFTDTTAGSPTTFALAYNSAATATGELASNFFTVNLISGVVDPSSLQVNAALLNGTSAVKQASGSVAVTALSAARNFTADGLTLNGGSYTDLSAQVLSNFQQAANSLSTQSTAATQQQTYYQQSLSNATGVNVDNELIQLTTLQNSYAASAHVISTINQMLTTLNNIL